ncbi:unnamed protein product [Toxocara canis]|uniref:RING-type E3 ubiquitin transferase n=1 Tax=Toxocara canis TaxID=6265 RepID=A0A183UAY9_TOXCA|nr:unnamed protein product [Toxocara canis]
MYYSPQRYGKYDGEIRCDVCMALLGCGELGIVTDGNSASCIDGENVEIDEITAVQGIQGKVRPIIQFRKLDLIMCF